MPDEEKLISHYQLKTLLRRDGFGAVYLAEGTRDQKEYVLRVIELDQQTLTRITGRVRARSQRDHPLIERIRQRMKRISELKHSHILPVLEFGEEHMQGNNDITFYMVSPFEKESLLSYWTERVSSGSWIELEVVADLLFQAAEALFYVHKRSLVHQYVRLSSFMLRSSARGRRHPHLLLTDFWFADISAALLEEGQIAQDLSVYLAPEQLSGGAIAASDQYALAVLAYELLLGHRLSKVDLSLGLYERFARQRAAEGSEMDLEIARRIDQVLARALAENASARFHNIEEFAHTFRAVARGEAIELADEETTQLAVVPPMERGESQRGEEIVAAVGTLVAGEIAGAATEQQVTADNAAEMLAAAEVTKEQHPEHHRGLHKTVLTSEGMATASALVEEEATFREVSQSVEISEEETFTTAEAEKTQSSAGAGTAGFAAGLAAGATLQRESDIAEEQTLVAESSAAAFAAGATLQRESDIAENEAAAFAAGLAAGEARQREVDIAEEQTLIMENGSAALAAGAAGLAAGEILAGAGKTGEATQVAGAVGGGAGLGTLESTEVASGAAGLAAGSFAATGTTRQSSGALIAGGAAGGVTGRRGRGGRRLLVAALLALIFVLVFGGVAFALFQFGNQSSATITLTLESHTIQNTYLVTAVTTTTTAGQVQAKVLTSTVSQSKTGQTSGYYAGSHASGFITFKNRSTGCGCPVIIPAGTAFTGASGVTVVTDTVASVASQCSVTVRAHALIFGPGGDIPAGDIHAAYNAHVSATNLAFSGGQAGQSNSLVQQSDITSLTTALQKSATQSAQAALQAQIQSNQHLLGTPVCRAKTSSNHGVGDIASSVTVTVSETCTVEAYDYAGATQIVQQEVQRQVSTYFSSKFVLLDKLQTMVTSATVIDAKAGTILLAIKAAGKWGYQFSNNLKQSLAKVIAGKNVNEVRSLLGNEDGVAAVNITISGSDQGHLPSDDSRITIILRD
jgi:hypothetical protein